MSRLKLLVNQGGSDFKYVQISLEHINLQDTKFCQ